MPKIQKNKVSLYADDSKLIGHEHDREYYVNTRDLDKFTFQADAWRLELNASKCKSIKIGKKIHALSTIWTVQLLDHECTQRTDWMTFYSAEGDGNLSLD